MELFSDEYYNQEGHIKAIVCQIHITSTWSTGVKNNNTKDQSNLILRYLYDKADIFEPNVPGGTHDCGPWAGVAGLLSSFWPS